ncbi:hypothetical protein BLA60_04715 [Actinophytocola xinjiangensis]|uniref:MbtH-like domain-containing protein n=1 Tax=Actinophytocola xinjiangensis TaxID=485602 RepID=A0A7Z1B1L7_9PSEU|nr:MbtH family NRPS accessory protein [Actinophytocola xinjiangensis]OLF14426.1 hypothetical protein BLA60_04715 [Actinophytocola xinjiangensis]
MPDTDRPDEVRDHHVVVNHEEQYSLWPVQRAVPAGWTVIGEARTRAECLSYLDSTWTDLRPRSLRERTAEGGR